MNIIFLIIAILPFFYKFSFWLYTIQLKEYRWDRFKEYLWTPQWKSALQNFWFALEVPLFFLTILILIRPDLFLWIVTLIMFYFLVFQNIFVLWKIFRKKLIYPKLTSRMLILISCILIWLSIDVYFLSVYFPIWTYSYIMLVLISTPLIIFICNYIISPIVNYKKNKLIKAAIYKSQTITKPIKIAITWSYGKSSVKEYLSQILAFDHNILKTPENINTELWVSSLILSKLDDKFEYFVAEAWAYKIWEIKTLWEIINHKYWFLTAIWTQHLWLFWSIENTKKGKFEIAKKVVENDWVLYINWNNENIKDYVITNKLWDLKDLKYIRYWLWDVDLDAKSKIIAIKDGLTEFIFTYKDIEYNFKTNLIGSHNILNLTWILAFLFDMWFEYEKLRFYLTQLQTPKNTLAISELNSFTIIDDTYNLSEWWLFAWIEVLNTIAKDKNRVLIMDDILELWEQSKDVHYSIWKRLANEKLIDYFIFTGVNYKEDIIKWLLENGFKKDTILRNLDTIPNSSVILLEGRKSRNYLDKLN